MSENHLMTDDDAAALMRVSRNTIWRWVRENDAFPKPVRLTPSTPRWRRADLDAYIASRATAQQG